MTNLERVVAVLERHREARRWADEAVARDLLAELGVDVDGRVLTATEVDPAATVEPAAPTEPSRTSSELGLG